MKYNIEKRLLKIPTPFNCLEVVLFFRLKGALHAERVEMFHAIVVRVKRNTCLSRHDGDTAKFRERIRDDQAFIDSNPQHTFFGKYTCNVDVVDAYVTDRSFQF